MRGLFVDVGAGAGRQCGVVRRLGDRVVQLGVSVGQPFLFGRVGLPQGSGPPLGATGRPGQCRVGCREEAEFAGQILARAASWRAGVEPAAVEQRLEFVDAARGLLFGGDGALDLRHERMEAAVPGEMGIELDGLVLPVPAEIFVALGTLVAADSRFSAFGIFRRFTGIMIHDRWRYRQATPAICNAHILRDLAGVAEIATQRPWTMPWPSC